MSKQGMDNSKPERGIVRRVWNFFSSLKLALVLMLVMVGLSLIGTFLVQVPVEYTQNLAQYNYWLENTARPATGGWYPILHLLGLFNVFHSVWFLGVGALLIVSIIICTLNRWKQVKSSVSLKPPVTDDLYYLSSDGIEIKRSPSETELRSRITALFKRSRYTILEENMAGNLYATADKNRFSPLGTYLIHLSLVLFIIGFLTGSFLGFRDSSFIVAEGETREVGYDTGLSLNLQSFTDEYWENGSPRDYRSRVIILENSREVKQGTVQVNHPLSYKGIRFYQSFFGETAKIDLKDDEGKTLFSGNVLLSRVINDSGYLRPAGYVQLAESGYTIYVLGKATNIEDRELAENQIGIEIYSNKSSQPVVSARLNAGEPFTTSDLNIVYSGNGKFSGFQVSRDPGNAMIWIASALFLLGLVAVFYFPRQQIHFCVLHSPAGSTHVYLRYGAGRRTGNEAEMKRLETAIIREFG